MFDATDQQAVALFNPFLCVVTGHIVQGKFQLGQQEGVEHKHCLAQWQREPLYRAHKLHDHLSGLALLIVPPAVKARMHSEVSDGLIVWHGLRRDRKSVV